MEKLKEKVKEFMNPNDDPKTHHQRAKKVWKSMQMFLEDSAYSYLGDAGETRFQKFPVTLMSKANREAYYYFKGEMKEVEESYLNGQAINEAKYGKIPVRGKDYEQSIAKNTNNKLYITDSDADKRAKEVFEKVKHTLEPQRQF